MSAGSLPERVAPGVEDVMQALASADADLPNWWGGTQFRALAEQVHAALFAAQPTVDDVREQVIEEVAREFQMGGWTILTAPPPAGAIPSIALGQRVTDWLRDRVGGEA